MIQRAFNARELIIYFIRMWEEPKQYLTINNNGSIRFGWNKQLWTRFDFLFDLDFKLLLKMDEDHVALIDDVHVDYDDWMHLILEMMCDAISADSWHSSENLRNYHWNETIDNGSGGWYFFSFRISFLQNSPKKELVFPFLDSFYFVLWVCVCV